MSTRKFLSEELSRLRHDILLMSAKAEENIGKALTALRTLDSELAKEVRTSDAEVDALQHKIDDDAAYLLATQQPVARDLREIVTVFKITGNLERIGDYAVHLARAAKKLAKKKDSPLKMQLTAKFPAQEYLVKMAETGQLMIRAATAAFLTHDAQAAREAAAIDSKIDSEHKELTEKILKLMKKNPDLVKSALEILQTSNQLERLGDHITNICEAVIYMIEGTHEELNE
ncbi:MAG: phosphate signaling complex protein PhoU [Treponema sp.]|nr:phosphate signaling complex protein PhoU [Treponema sp.]